MADEAALANLLNELAKIRGLDFRGYKPASLQRRLHKRLVQLNIGSYDEYLEHFHKHPDEVNRLLEVVLINVTHFFRDPQAWEALRIEALPLIFATLKPGDSFRAWCAGCATGEEVYSVAMFVAEYFGPRLSEYDIKIYATDHDEDALTVARRGEYKVDAIRRVPPEWRERYFAGSGSLVRVQRDVRRLCIFGRSNLVTDAPISHVHLLVCRNVLIYFDMALQRQVLEKFHYALNSGGILFLGRSESQLRELSQFRPINGKWRIFQCGKLARGLVGRDAMSAETENREMESMRQMQKQVIDTLRSGVIMLDTSGAVVAANLAAIQVWGLGDLNIAGVPLSHTPIPERCPRLLQAIQDVQVSGRIEPVRFQNKFTVNDEERSLEITVRPLYDPEGTPAGTLIHADDSTAQEKLRTTVEELETTAEELHSSNEELETTNEELQSTNEELETTNEELQSTNEELETTNEELHSLNEELETTNDELEQRTRDLEEMSARYAETLALMPLPIVVVNDAAEVQLWNSASEKLFGIDAKGMTGLKLKQLPLGSRLRATMVRRHEGVVRSQQASVVRGVHIDAENFTGEVDLRFTPIPGSAGRGVLIVIDPHYPARAAGKPEPAARVTAKRKAVAAKKSPARKAPAKKPPRQPKSK